MKEIEEVVDEPLDQAIVKALINELRRKLSEFILIDKTLRRKYSMSFEEFKAKKILEEKELSFEVETDYCDWEMAIDGIRTIREKIEKLEKFL